MKLLYSLFLFIVIANKSFGQDSSWKRFAFNKILSINLPAKTETNKSGFIKAIGGEINQSYYALQFYDTVFLPITDENKFSISLKGFISGRISDTSLKKYNVVVVDTLIGGVKGLFATFSTNNVSLNYKHIYYFVTIANNQYYWFYVYSSAKNRKQNIDFFFKSIVFNTTNIKEKEFNLSPTHLIKQAE